jgi:small GTP-binding protein
MSIHFSDQFHLLSPLFQSLLIPLSPPSMLGHRFDYSLKIVVLGDSGVGKTCLLLRFVRDAWDSDSQPTLGVEFLAKIINTDKHRIQLQLWDTAGQELFRSITRGYYRGSAGALLMFDLTSRATFLNIERWLQDLREIARPDLTTILIGNKADLTEQREVPQDEARTYAETNHMAYFETSAKTGDNVTGSVTSCVLEIEKKVDEGIFSLTPIVEPQGFKQSQAVFNCPC